MEFLYRRTYEAGQELPVYGPRVAGVEDEITGRGPPGAAGAAKP